MNNKTLVTGIAAGLMFTLAGCTTVNPYTQEQQTSKAAMGAGAGAVTGAIIGAMKGDRKTALKGAVLGAAAGGGVGYYMDVQEAKLRQRLSGTGVSVSRVGNNLILNMPGNVTFTTGNSSINAGFYQVLDSVAIILKEYSDTTITVIGHTDSVGDEAYNQGLSEQRAQSVASYLRSQGVVGQRFNVMGYGEQSPIASNSTKEGRAQNRRVEITLTPLNVR
ncbi:MAG: outer membrane protein OmpA-like peptidoglycan-associated protein [Cycloclasticus pugetii]|jgi:outer membrane protein OmpA-like peptidoglycan-associated protein|uniref:OmpA/MotB domain-containing protein n=2 Tax=Cycloclasticus TaxID=34067 RepID=S5T6J0_9GAMM|nr:MULTISPECIES: OmpA family protein [Cycloclasticus]AFT67692.1 OmpA family protein [Cycloclasticus sp. P1]AGS39139.1 OmpA/MotB domain-containing protein [Cycloclasticus zancles 78-ME]ATI02765.1 glycine zipper 2TM domain-containing protein [Cycloclasticus sp. PY97N]EPD13509.1 OmpA family protein [Cycloclasticus pugetii]MBV1897746.1 OmpA family protein [Cycloclasticus sp.]|tara:strand:+ start:145 stop:804 length:660 start_codon:yes stop_codon:yes gene_type:complete